MIDWFKKKVIGALKAKGLRLLQEQSTRKAIISLVVGAVGYQWTEGKIDAAASLLGATYAFLSLFMEDKKPVPPPAQPVPTPQQNELRPVDLNEVEPDALTVNGQPVGEKWDGTIPGGFRQ